MVWNDMFMFLFHIHKYITHDTIKNTKSSCGRILYWLIILIPHPRKAVSKNSWLWAQIHIMVTKMSHNQWSCFSSWCTESPYPHWYIASESARFFEMPPQSLDACYNMVREFIFLKLYYLIISENNQFFFHPFNLWKSKLFLILFPPSPASFPPLTALIHHHKSTSWYLHIVYRTCVWCSPRAQWSLPLPPSRFHRSNSPDLASTGNTCPVGT